MNSPEIYDPGNLALRILQNAPVVILVLDLECKIKHANPYFERLTGYRLAEVRGKDWINTFVPERDRERIRDQFGRSRTGEHVRGYVNPIVTRTGEELQIEWTDEFLLDDKGEPNGILAIGQDVTERKAAEEALRISEQRLAEAHRIANIGSWEVDVKTGAGWWSEEQYRMRGISPETPVTHDLFLETLHPDDRGMLEQGFQTTLTAGNWEGEYRIIRPNGQARVLYARAKRINDAQGKPIKLAGTNQDVTERRAAEKKVAEQARMLDLIFQHSLDNIAILDKNYKFVRVSASYARANKMDISEFIGKNHFEMFPSDFEQELAPYRQSKQIYHKTERPFIYPNHPDWGTTFWDLGMVPILDTAGEVEFYLFTLKDVTDRKRAEVALRLSEARYRTIVETSEEGVWTLDADARTSFVNQKMAAMLGYTVEEMAGRPMFDFMDAEAQQTAGQNLERHHAGIRERHDFKLRSKKGDTVWTSMATSPLYAADGRYAGALAMVADITESKQVEEALRAGEARYRAMIAAMPDLLFRIDKDMRYLDVAAADPSQLILPPETFLGKTLLEVFGSQTPQVTSAEFTGATSFVQTTEDAVRLALETGELQVFEYTLGSHAFEARIVRSGADEVLAIVRDVTERKRAEELLRAAIDSRDNLLAVVSHDLRSPLSAIQLSAEMLAHTDSAEAVKVEVILRAAERMNRMIGDLLQAASIEAGKFTVEPKREQVSSIIEEALQGLNPMTAAKAVHLGQEIPQTLPWIRCDRQRVIQVLSNLIGNAIKFAPSDGGDIRVRASAQGDHVCFSVTDNGPGIAAEQALHLFDRYWKGEEERRRGFGLGLYIAKGIIEAHGGRIWVESQASAGSTFYFTLPIEQSEQKPRQTPKGSATRDRDARPATAPPPDQGGA